jgi:DNA-binding response OmpR family regulator
VKVLVADDDETIRALVMRLFKRRGDEVTGASDGAAAVELLDAETFDLLVLDLMMPRLDGFGVLAHLRERTAPSPAVLVMSAAVPTLAASVPKDQIAALITKPFDLALLLQLAEEAVDGKG